jgi:hypothetical protein
MHSSVLHVRIVDSRIDSIHLARDFSRVGCQVKSLSRDGSTWLTAPANVMGSDSSNRLLSVVTGRQGNAP